MDTLPYAKKKSWCFGEWLPSLRLTAPANSWLEDNFPSNGPVLYWWCFCPRIFFRLNFSRVERRYQPSSSSWTIRMCGLRPHIQTPQLVFFFGDRVRCGHHLYLDTPGKNPVHRLHFMWPMFASYHPIVFLSFFFFRSIHVNHRPQWIYKSRSLRLRIYQRH